MNFIEQLDKLNALDFGVTLALLLVIHKALSIGGQYWLNRNAPPLATLACQQDPAHFQRIKEMHKAIMDTEEKKLRGDFGCKFNNRDEVRDLLEIMRQNTEALKMLTQELRLTRNGGRNPLLGPTAP